MSRNTCGKEVHRMPLMNTKREFTGEELSRKELTVVFESIEGGFERLEGKLI